MHEAMASQPSELTRILADPEPVESVATRIRGARRILLAGTGTSYHAANHGAYLLRLAGREAWAIEPFAATTGGPTAAAGDALIVLSHRNSKRYTTIARDEGALARWTRDILAHLAGKRPRLDLPLDVQTTAFEWQVWQALAAIPYGETRSYSEVAASIGRPRAVRAVANACAHNPVAVAIPCHRVVPATGGPGGYRWGAARKKALLARERSDS